jgi:MSHA pilin protein MshA
MLLSNPVPSRVAAAAAHPLLKLQPRESSMQRPQHQAGFTLVELVIVILILGILSAVALPRFLNLGTEARQAKMDAIFGSVRAAAQITRAAALVQSNGAAAAAASSTVTLDGGPVNTVFGYPAATAAGIVAAAGLDATNDKVTVTVNAGATPPNVTIDINGAATAANCRITYRQATAAGDTPEIELPASPNCG